MRLRASSRSTSSTAPPLGSAPAGASGTTYFAALSVAAATAVDFVLAFDEQPARARDVLAAAPAEPLDADWTQGLSKPHSTDPRYLAAQERAPAILRMGEVTDLS